MHTEVSGLLLLLMDLGCLREVAMQFVYILHMWQVQLKTTNKAYLGKIHFFTFSEGSHLDLTSTEFQDHLVLLRDDLRCFLSICILDETAILEYIIILQGHVAIHINNVLCNSRSIINKRYTAYK